MNITEEKKSKPVEQPKSNLPSGMTFLLYCAGLSLLGLVGYVIVSGKQFNFTAGEKGIEFKTALNREGVPSDPVVRSAKSEEIREKFAAAAAILSEPPASPIHSESKVRHTRAVEDNYAPEAKPEVTNFNGTWVGNGSSYGFQQNGTNLALIETTNGVATSYAQGTINGKSATMTAVNISGLTFPITVEMKAHRLYLTAMGNSFALDRE